MSTSTSGPPPRASPYPIIPMSDALSTITTALSPLSTHEKVLSSCALRRTLATDVVSPVAHPPFRASMKDGYAVSSSAAWTADTAFSVVGSTLAGAGNTPAIKPGSHECAYITTGAPLPDGADAIIMVERSRPHNADSGDGNGKAANAGAEETVCFEQWVKEAGEDVRQVGSDVAQGEVILRAGERVGAAELGLLISCAVSSVEVVRRVRIGVMSTGDEIVDAADVAKGMVMASGKIIDSNRPMLLSLVEESLPACEAVDLGIVQDDYDSVKEALSTALQRCDIVITSGGVSMGSHDVVKPVLAEIATVHFGRVCMKPGKPLTFATSEEHNSCAIGLPGNPVSAFVCFHLAVIAAARRLSGLEGKSALGNIVHATLAHDMKLDKQRPEYHRVTLEWTDKGYLATSTGSQRSSRLLSARSADGLLVLPASEGVQTAGSVLPVYIL